MYKNVLQSMVFLCYLQSHMMMDGTGNGTTNGY